jgi:tRNA A-37 threonylcarbamoyl transferase component Bud32
MRVSDLPALLMPARRARTPIDLRVVVHPSAHDSFCKLGLTTAQAFLDVPGEIVSGHPDRHVMRVVLDDGRTAYLKREHRIRWRFRLRNWRANFGFVSNSVREGRILQAVEAKGLPVPRWLAFGADGHGRAFLLLDEAGGALDLPRAWPAIDCPESLAIRLGRTCAEMHEAGVDHPDLYAKHFLVEPSTNATTVIDWQRATIVDRVSWPRRARALAALCATFAPFEMTGANGLGDLGDLFLWAYLRVVDSAQRTDTPDVSTLAEWVGRETARFAGRRSVQAQRQPPLERSAQRLVWLDGEALCAAPEIAADLEPPSVQKMLYDPSRNANLFGFAGGRTARLEVADRESPLGRMWAWVRRKAWRSRQLRKARLLFHLERHHVPAPKVLAFGQRSGGMHARAFLLAETLDAIPFPDALRDADADMRHLLMKRLAATLNRLHDAGCEVQAIDSFAVKQRLGGLVTVVVGSPDRLIFRKRLSARRRKSDWNRVARSMIHYCGRDEIRDFLDDLAENR